MPDKFIFENKYDYIIWDWNGTLYNDVAAGIETVNDMLTERGLPPLDVVHYKEIFDFPIKGYYERAGFDFLSEPYEKLASVFIEKNNARLGESKLSKNAEVVLQEIENRGIKQLILSATRQDILHLQVGLFGIEHYFATILGKKDFYAYGKDEIAREWLRSTGANRDKILIIGDTLHDFEIAKALGCDCILVSFGHQSKSRLKNTNARVIDDLKDVLQAI